MGVDEILDGCLAVHLVWQHQVILDGLKMFSLVNQLSHGRSCGATDSWLRVFDQCSDAGSGLFHPKAGQALDDDPPVLRFILE